MPAITAERKALFEYLPKLGAVWTYVGSSVTCYPPPVFTDVDVLVYVPKGKYHKLERTIKSWQFVPDGKEKYPGSDRPGAGFNSWRYGDTNLIITCSPKFYNSFCLAADVCKYLNLKQKAHRIIVHSAIMTGKLHG